MSIIVGYQLGGGGVSIVNAILPNCVFLKGRTTSGGTRRLIGVGDGAATCGDANATVISPDGGDTSFGRAGFQSGTGVATALNLYTVGSVNSDTCRIRFNRLGDAGGSTFGPLTAGDSVGLLDYRGSDVAGSTRQVATIETLITGVIAANDIGAAIVFSTRPSGVGGVIAEALRLNSSQQAVFKAGTAASPAAVGTGFLTTGLYWAAGPLLGISVSGATVATVTATGFNLTGRQIITQTGIADALVLNGTANQTTYFALQTGGTLRWQIYPDASNNLVFANSGGTTVFRFDLATGNLLLTQAATLLSTGATLTDYAGAGGGTLTNAPSAGNPAKWIRINDNGTVRYIPTWV